MEYFFKTFLDEPLDFVVDGLLVGAGGIAQLGLCLGAVKFVVANGFLDIGTLFIFMSYSFSSAEICVFAALCQFEA